MPAWAVPVAVAVPVKAGQDGLAEHAWRIHAEVPALAVAAAVTPIPGRAVDGNRSVVAAKAAAGPSPAVAGVQEQHRVRKT